MATKKNTQKGKKSWIAQELRTVKLSEVLLNDHNPREHTLEQIEQISRSMDKFGWTVPMLLDENFVLLAGHGRVRAARLKGWTEGPAIVANGWSEEQKRAYLIADNQIAANSSWDRKQLQGEIRALMASNFDIPLLGFSDLDLKKLILDPASMTGEPQKPEEVTMQICPTCGRAKRKVEE